MIEWIHFSFMGALSLHGWIKGMDVNINHSMTDWTLTERHCIVGPVLDFRHDSDIIFSYDRYMFDLWWRVWGAGSRNNIWWLSSCPIENLSMSGRVLLDRILCIDPVFIHSHLLPHYCLFIHFRSFSLCLLNFLSLLSSLYLSLLHPYFFYSDHYPA